MSGDFGDDAVDMLNRAVKDNEGSLKQLWRDMAANAMKSKTGDREIDAVERYRLKTAEERDEAVKLLNAEGIQAAPMIGAEGEPMLVILAEDRERAMKAISGKLEWSLVDENAELAKVRDELGVGIVEKEEVQEEKPATPLGQDCKDCAKASHAPVTTGDVEKVKVLEKVKPPIR
jgi:hypothetical protein